MQHRGTDRPEPDTHDLLVTQAHSLSRKISGLQLAGPLISAVLFKPGLGTKTVPDETTLDTLAGLVSRVIQLTSQVSNHLSQQNQLLAPSTHYLLAAEAVWLVAEHWRMDVSSDPGDLVQLMTSSLDTGVRLLGDLDKVTGPTAGLDDERLTAWLGASIELHTGLLNRPAAGHDKRNLADSMLEHLADQVREFGAEIGGLENPLAVRRLIREFGNLYLPLWDAEVDQLRQTLSGLNHQEQIAKARELNPYPMQDYFTRVTSCARLCLDTADALDELIQGGQDNISSSMASGGPAQ